MKIIGAYDAKSHLSDILKRVAEGEVYVVTRHGHPVAKIIPAGDSVYEAPAEVIEKLRAFRRGRKLDGLELKDLIEEGRA